MKICVPLVTTGAADLPLAPETNWGPDPTLSQPACTITCCGEWRYTSPDDYEGPDHGCLIVLLDLSTKTVSICINLTIAGYD